MEHWIPFDQARLERDLGLHGRQLEAFLVDDHHTLAELARRRRVDVAWLAGDLVAPWRRRIGPRRLAVLRGRTMRLLTQGHLAQHVFFHVFHRFGLAPVAHRLFGVSGKQLDVLRKQGLTPLQVAARHGGVSEPAMIRALVRLVRKRRAKAIRRGQTWPAEADRFMARQIESIPCWVRSLTPTDDPGNPYGKAIRQHGVHPRGWPATPQARRTDEQRVELARRGLHWTCWPRVPAWHWSAGGHPPRRATRVAAVAGRDSTSASATSVTLHCSLWSRAHL